jgi:antitoxin (DNA-binding transcriptional repressor) of toxin-antitoxin stability system
MKATVVDLRRRMKDVLNSLRRNEPVTLLRRGTVVGTIQPPGAAPNSKTGPPGARHASAHPAFGMWKDRADLEDVEAAVGRLRRGRFDAH